MSTKLNLAASARATSMEFPELRIVSRNDVLLHEEMDAARQIRLIERLSSDGVLKNPPIVARLNGTGRYLLLDGANRVAALDYLNTPHLLVQVEDYDDPRLILSHWNHVVRDQEARTLVDMVREIPGVFVLPARGSGGGEDDGHRLCTLVLDEGVVFHVFGGRDVFERIRLLRRVSGLYYHGGARIDRVNHDELDVVKNHHSNFGAIICYPDFSKDDVREAAEKGCRFASGLTRFLMPRRVLNFNLSLDTLQSNRPLAEKRRCLEEAIQKKVTGQKIRFYAEPTFIFDD